MNESITFGINGRVAKCFGTRTAAVFGWLFAHCQSAAVDAGATRGGAGWVSVSQVELGRRLHLSRHTVSSILAKLSDAGLIVAANAYTDGEGGCHWREVEPDPKGAADRERTDTAKSTEPTKAEHSCTDDNAEHGSPANASRGCPAKASPCLAKEQRCEFLFRSCETKTRKRLVFASRERLAKTNRWYTIGEEGFHVMGRKSYDWQMKNQEMMLSWAANEAVCAIVGVNAAIVFQHLWFWANNRGASPGSTRAARVWKAHSAASLSRECAFMSDDVILTSLHRLEDEGLILRRRGRWALLWAIADAGFDLMGEKTPAGQEDSLCLKPKLRPSSPAPLAFAPSCHRVDAGRAARVRDVRRALSTQLNWWQVQGLRTRHLRW